MERLGSSVDRELGRFGPSGSMPAIVTAWPGAVGEEVARNAWPARVARDGTLHVATSSSAWAFELTQLAAVVLEQLTGALHGEPPKAIRFTPGHLPEPLPSDAADASHAPLEPAPERVAEARELVAEMEDEELRERVARAAALSLEAARADRRF